MSFGKTANTGKVDEVIARTATVNTLLTNVRQQIQDVVHAADMIIGRQHAGANRQSMLPSQALRSPGDPAHNPRQGDEAINKPSTSCASMKTTLMMTRSNIWNVIVSQTMTGETRFLRLWISLRNGARERDATLKVKVDTGAQWNILPVRIFKRMYPELLDESGVPSKRHLRHRPTILTAFNGAAMTQL